MFFLKVYYTLQIPNLWSFRAAKLGRKHLKAGRERRTIRFSLAATSFCFSLFSEVWTADPDFDRFQFYILKIIKCAAGSWKEEVVWIQQEHTKSTRFVTIHVSDPGGLEPFFKFRPPRNFGWCVHIAKITRVLISDAFNDERKKYTHFHAWPANNQ